MIKLINKRGGFIAKVTKAKANGQAVVFAILGYHVGGGLLVTIPLTNQQRKKSLMP
jgi:hypothetical protein